MILHLNNSNYAVYSVAILGIYKANNFKYIKSKIPYIYFTIGDKRSNIRVKCYPESYFRFRVFNSTTYSQTFVDIDSLNYWIKQQM